VDIKASAEHWPKVSGTRQQGEIALCQSGAIAPLQRVAHAIWAEGVAAGSTLADAEFFAAP